MARGSGAEGSASVRQEKKKGTVASVTARRDALLRTRDALRALVAGPAPRELTAAEKKRHAEFVAKVHEIAEGCDAAAAKLTAGLGAVSPKLDSLSEMGETESLRLQMEMDRMSKMMSTLSNLLKKMGDTASGIVQNLK